MSTVSESHVTSDDASRESATRRPRATILDVARAADVAPSTVSLVTNGTGYVSAERRRVVEDAVRRLGYRPRGQRKAAARSATSSGSRPTRSEARAASEQALDVVMIYVPVPGRPGAATETVLSVLEGANGAFSQRTIRPSLVAAADHIEEDVVLLNHLQSRPIDGAILLGLGGATGQGYVEQMGEAGVPMVLVGSEAPDHTISSVNADFFGGSRRAADHLLGLGHRRIGFIGLSSDHWPTAERQRGYEQAMWDKDLPIDEPFFTSDMAGSASREAAMRSYLEAAMGRGCTGFLMGDFHALIAVPILEEMGVKVPGEVSVVGFDGLGLEVGGESLGLSSMSYDKRYLGAMAVQTLLEVLEAEGKLAAADKTVRVELHAGATTAQAPESRSR